MKPINRNNLTKKCTMCFTNLIPREVGSYIGNCYISNYKNRIYKCNSCVNIYKSSKTKKYRQEKTVGCSIHLQDLIEGARERAKKNKLPFNLKVKDLRKIITSHCPIFGFKFELNKKDINNSWKNSPTLDRIIPEKGYVKNNIIIISMLANCIKSCATPEQIFKVGNFYSKLYEEKGIKYET